MNPVFTFWCIMSKDRKVIAAGHTRNRSLERVSDIESGAVKKRILLYGSKAKAEAAFTNHGFYHQDILLPEKEYNELNAGLSSSERLTLKRQDRFKVRLSDHLEAVEVTITPKTETEAT